MKHAHYQFLHSYYHHYHLAKYWMNVKKDNILLVSTANIAIQPALAAQEVHNYNVSRVIPDTL